MPEPIRTALLSLYDKRGIVDFARFLEKRGIVLLSTGGTAKTLQDQGITVTDIRQRTDFPSILSGRVKTLHPGVHAGILARRDDPEHMQSLARMAIGTIDLVVVNLYPFAATLASGADANAIIEMIDVGGPTMLRAAAKNHQDVVVCSDPADYAMVMEQIEATGHVDMATRRRLAGKAFSLSADYERAIADWMNRDSRKDAGNKRKSDTGDGKKPTRIPDTITICARRQSLLRYGENPHQRGAFYAFDRDEKTGFAAAVRHQGADLSWNNLNDSNGAISLAREFTEPCAVIVKHATPCGVAVAKHTREAWEKALACDRTSAFGGIVAFNRPIDSDTAHALLDIFLEVVLAPSIDPAALAVLARKPSLRVIEMDIGTDARNIDKNTAQSRGQGTTQSMNQDTAQSVTQNTAQNTGQSIDQDTDPAHDPIHDPVHLGQWDMRLIRGGILLQDHDGPHNVGERADMRVVSRKKPTEKEWKDMLFAAIVCRHVRSNAIVYARDSASIGIGGGQTSRVEAARLGRLKIHDTKPGCVVASDAFFPFADGLEEAIKAGVTAVIQPGGSKRDDDVIALADARNIAMVFSARRGFRH